MARTKQENVDAPQARLATPREPAQERSRARYKILLDATAKLIEERDFVDVGLYDIGDLAKVPPASVYHFFPTKEAAFVALAKRYLNDLALVLLEPPELDGINSWQDLLALRYQRAVRYYNSQAAFSRIAFSGSTVSEVRRLDADYLSDIDHTPLGWLSRYVVLPYLPDAPQRFSCLVGIYDGIWTVSYSRHGRITDDFAREGLRAGIAYCGTFLPDVTPLRAPPEIPESIAARPTRRRAKSTEV